MSGEQKTAKEFFNDESEKQWQQRSGFLTSDPGSISRIPYVIHPAIHKVMQAYADQQNAALKAALTELKQILLDYKSHGVEANIDYLLSKIPSK